MPFQALPYRQYECDKCETTVVCGHLWQGTRKTTAERRAYKVHIDQGSTPSMFPCLLFCKLIMHHPIRTQKMLRSGYDHGLSHPTCRTTNHCRTSARLQWQRSTGGHHRERHAPLATADPGSCLSPAGACCIGYSMMPLFLNGVTGPRATTGAVASSDHAPTAVVVGAGIAGLAAAAALHKVRKQL